MKTPRIRKLAAVAALTIGAVALAGWLRNSPRVHAQDQEQDSEWRVKIGFEIAPVPLKLEGKDLDLVGLGSYWVNAVSDCNSCHTAGGPPNFNYAAGGNPYFGQHQKIDPTTYLAGGSDFGPVLPPGFYAEGYGSYLGPDIISRNLTPDKTGRPVGGAGTPSNSFLRFCAPASTLTTNTRLAPRFRQHQAQQTAFRLRMMAIFSRSCPGLTFTT
jgi:hypothetical protein